MKTCSCGCDEKWDSKVTDPLMRKHLWENIVLPTHLNLPTWNKTAQVFSDWFWVETGMWHEVFCFCDVVEFWEPIYPPAGAQVFEVIPGWTNTTMDEGYRVLRGGDSDSLAELRFGGEITWNFCSFPNCLESSNWTTIDQRNKSNDDWQNLVHLSNPISTRMVVRHFKVCFCQVNM